MGPPRAATSGGAVRDVQDRSERAVEGLRRPLPGAGDDDRQGVTEGPAGPRDDLPDDRGDVWRPLIGAVHLDRGPRWRQPRNARGSTGTRRDVERAGGEG